MDAAIRELQLAIQLQADFPEAQNSLGVLLQRAGNVDDAIESFQRVLQQQPGEPMNYNTGNTHLLSAILTKVSGSDTWSEALVAGSR